MCSLKSALAFLMTKHANRFDINIDSKRYFKVPVECAFEPVNIGSIVYELPIDFSMHNFRLGAVYGMLMMRYDT